MTRRPVKRLSALVVGAAIAMTPALVPGAPAETTGGITLLDRTPWVEVGEVFALQVAVDAARVEATVYQELVGGGGRSRFTNQLEGGLLGGPVGESRELRRQGDGSWALLLVVTDGDASDPRALALSTPGVYPVAVRSYDTDGSPRGELLTHAVRVPSDDGFPPLSVAVSVHPGLPTAQQPDGTDAFPPDAAARIRRIGAAATAAPDTPFLVDVAPAALDALPIRPRAQLRAGAAVVTTGQPWAALDEGAWLADGRVRELLEHQWRRGDESTAAARIGTTDAVALDSAPTPDEIERLAGRPLLVTPELVSSNANPVIPDLAPVPVAGSGQSALVADPQVLSRLTDTDDPRLGVHHALAELAVIFYDRPAQSRATYLRVDNPAVVGDEALTQLIVALSGNPIALAIDPERATQPNRFDPAGDATVELVASAPGELGGYPDRLASIRSELASWQSMLVRDDSRADDLSRRLDATAATDVIDDAARWFSVVRAEMRHELIGLEIVQRQTVTLTSRDANVPLAIQNDLGYPAEVRIELRSTRLEFPALDAGDRMQTRLENGLNEIVVPVRARASGSFPLRVIVTSPDGRFTLAEDGFSVRSTVFTGVGIALSVGSLLILVVWWWRSFRKGRRAKRLIPAPEGPPPAQ